MKSWRNTVNLEIDNLKKEHWEIFMTHVKYDLSGAQKKCLNNDKKAENRDVRVPTS